MRETRTIPLGNGDSSKVKLHWSEDLPLPAEDAGERQLIDLAAVVAFDREADTATLQHLARRIAAAYRKMYGLPQTQVNSYY